jgi:hypothetical protein
MARFLLSSFLTKFLLPKLGAPAAAAFWLFNVPELSVEYKPTQCNKVGK